MAANSRLTIAVHAATWMALSEQRGYPSLTSEQVAASVNTNPVILRRCLGDLGRAGLVHVRRGRHAGWTLGRRPERITIRDLFDAVESGPLFALHTSEPNLECPVGLGIRPVLDQIYRRATDVMRHELARITVADVLADIVAGR
jgi:DNA-binding IscR family transcriptional regulator